MSAKIVSCLKCFFPVPPCVLDQVWAHKFGYGEAIGFSYIEGAARTSTLEVSFDDAYPVMDWQQQNLVQIALGGPPQVTTTFLTLDTYADGIFNDFQPLKMVQLPLTTSYYLLYDDGVNAMKRWLGEDDQQILQRRARFVRLLKDSFNITLDQSAFNNTEEASHVENMVGGVVPYRGLPESGLRVVSSLGIAEPPLFARQYDDQRLVEMGFLYQSSQGLIKQGVYVIENYEGDPEQSIYGVPISNRIDFQTKVPATVNEVNQAVVVEDIFVNATDGKTLWQCQGTYIAVNIQYPKSAHSEDTSFRLRGTMRFGQCFNKDTCEGRYCGTLSARGLIVANSTLCSCSASFCSPSFMCSKVCGGRCFGSFNKRAFRPPPDHAHLIRPFPRVCRETHREELPRDKL